MDASPLNSYAEHRNSPTCKFRSAIRSTRPSRLLGRRRHFKCRHPSYGDRVGRPYRRACCGRSHRRPKLLSRTIFSRRARVAPVVRDGRVVRIIRRVHVDQTIRVPRVVCAPREDRGERRNRPRPTLRRPATEVAAADVRCRGADIDASDGSRATCVGGIVFDGQRGGLAGGTGCDGGRGGGAFETFLDLRCKGVASGRQKVAKAESKMHAAVDESAGGCVGRGVGGHESSAGDRSTRRGQRYRKFLAAQRSGCPRGLACSDTPFLLALPCRHCRNPAGRGPFLSARREPVRRCTTGRWCTHQLAGPAPTLAVLRQASYRPIVAEQQQIWLTHHRVI